MSGSNHESRDRNKKLKMFPLLSIAQRSQPKNCVLPVYSLEQSQNVAQERSDKDVEGVQGAIHYRVLEIAPETRSFEQTIPVQFDLEVLIQKGSRHSLPLERTVISCFQGAEY